MSLAIHDEVKPSQLMERRLKTIRPKKKRQRTVLIYANKMYIERERERERRRRSARIFGRNGNELQKETTTTKGRKRRFYLRIVYDTNFVGVQRGIAARRGLETRTQLDSIQLVQFHLKPP